eukprot:scaffold128260_cov63-Phaeocystis_antarctica.AAC.2
MGVRRGARRTQCTDLGRGARVSADTRHKTDVEKRCNQSDGTQASSAAWCDDEGDKQLAGILDAGGDARIAPVHSCTRTNCLSVSGDGVWSTDCEHVRPNRLLSSTRAELTWASLGVVVAVLEEGGALSLLELGQPILDLVKVG